VKKNKKKPDSIVFDPDKNLYDSFLKPYSTSVSGPIIELPEVALFKSNSLAKANHKFSKRAEEIKEQIQSLVDEFADNQMIWESKMNFEPYAGIVVYVYEKENFEKFVSLISPEQWKNKFHCFGSFKLDTDFYCRRIHNK
jgi:hypothetical protein